MRPEWSPGLENRPPGIPRPFSRLWDRSRGPKPAKIYPKLPINRPRRLLVRKGGLSYQESMKATHDTTKDTFLRSSLQNLSTSSLGCANRSCGPPKPGRLLLSGVRRCRRRSAGGPSGPDGAPEGPWGRRRVPYGSVHQSCTDTGQSSDPSSPGG